MRVCLSCIEFFGAGVYGGFGRATRFIGQELVRRGVAVTVVVPRRTAHAPQAYDLDGMRVLEFDPRRPWTAARLFRDADADIYHSQDTSLGGAVAVATMRDRRHIVTFRDPMDYADWRIETDTRGDDAIGWRMQLYRAFVDNPLITAAVRRADAHFCAAACIGSRAAAKYGLDAPPPLLPTPVAIPPSVTKARRPTVCFIGRWHRRKRPERFFELARQFREVDFIAVGGGGCPAEDRRLRALAERIPNLELTGVIDQFQSNALSSILSKSWILVNTSSREGLPTTFLEAAAHRCAILSYVDPDGFASRFGTVACDQSIATGLTSLLDGDRWRDCGERAMTAIAGVFDTESAMRAHLDAYARVLGPASA